MFLKFRVDIDERIALQENVEKTLGHKPQEILFTDYPKTTNIGSQALVGYELPDRFLERHPKWQAHVES